MEDNLHLSQKKGKKQTRMIKRLMLPMILLAVLQLVTFFAILAIGGEFSFVRRYAYNTLVETTENRKNYIQEEFQQKIPYVQEASAEINSFIQQILEQQHATVVDLQTDRELNRLIMESSVDSLVNLLRRSEVNDVYLILETGSLYDNNGSGNAKGALYLRDLDTMTEAGYEDLLMEIGLSSIARDFGIMIDSGWTLHFEPDPEKPEDYDFYFRTLQTARENKDLSQEELGYWSGFSSMSYRSSASMKYSLPLIAEDGTVYGVLGIGLTENSILKNLPTNDFNIETACYVLGHGTEQDRFDIVTHSGAAFDWLTGDAQDLQISGMLTENVCDLSGESGVKLAGNVQYVTLYPAESPYAEEQWAVISVADRASVLRPLTNLVRMLAISAVFSVIVSIVVVILSCREVVKPISMIIKTMNSNQESNQVVRFQPTDIYEIDKMTEAITELQIHVRDFSSQVSRMIRIADVGLGVFVYDRTNDSVFVGQSLLKLMRFQMQQDVDVVMSRQDFLDRIRTEETKREIIKGLAAPSEEDYTREFVVAKEDGDTLWLRLGIVHRQGKSVGIIQDITGAMMEKQRIEYERDYDNITGLLNRRAYNRRIEELFSDPESLKVTAFMMLDLDNLKFVNDTYGHDFGDDYIKTAATALKKFQEYGGIVSRLSGDEFNICLSGFSSKEEVREIIREVREHLQQSYCPLADGTRYQIRASAGVAWYPDDADSSEVLMKYADFAMYTIKHSIKGGLAEFNMASYSSDSVLVTSVEEMNKILGESRVKYAFHSIVSAKTGEIYGYEALMRPQSAIFQSPMELLRAAKTGAKLNEFEHLAWRKALEDFQTQIDAGSIAEGCHIFINSISTSMPEALDTAALETVYPNLLPKVVLEVLENGNINLELLKRKAEHLKKWNARIALGEFGSGYNSEYAMIAAQPDIIKIDRSIISGCDKDISRRTIIKNLVKLAQSKHILVLAEGVETADELKTVISCEVDLLQGFYLSYPLFEPQPLEPKIVEMIQRLAVAENSGGGKDLVSERG